MAYGFGSADQIIKMIMITRLVIVIIIVVVIIITIIIIIVIVHDGGPNFGKARSLRTRP